MKQNNFIEKTISASVSIIQDSVFSERIASGAGLLQGIDARYKALSVFIFVLCALFTGHISLLLALYLFCLVLAALSGIRTVFFLERTLLFIPLFSLFIALPAVFSSITPGDTVWTFAGVSITEQGLYSAALLVCRVTVSVSFVVLLSLVTRHFELLKALGAFGVPQVFIMTAGMCYRYIYLFAETVAGTFLAIKSRAGGVVRPGHGRRIAAWNMAMLWKRSYALNEQVYNAMLSRGYAGTAVALVRFKTKTRDILWLIFSCAAAAVILITDRMLTGR